MLRMTCAAQIFALRASACSSTARRPSTCRSPRFENREECVAYVNGRIWSERTMGRSAAIARAAVAQELGCDEAEIVELANDTAVLPDDGYGHELGGNAYEVPLPALPSTARSTR